MAAVLLALAWTVPARAQQSSGAVPSQGVDSARVAGRADGAEAGRGVSIAKPLVGSFLVGGGTSLMGSLATGRAASPGPTLVLGLGGGFLLSKAAGPPNLTDRARERVAGESAAYRAAFLDAFQREAGRRRAVSMIVGAGIGAVLGWALYTAFVHET